MILQLSLKSSWFSKFFTIWPLKSFISWRAGLWLKRNRISVMENHITYRYIDPSRAIILKIVSFHDFPIKAAWASHWLWSKKSAIIIVVNYFEFSPFRKNAEKEGTFWRQSLGDLDPKKWNQKHLPSSEHISLKNLLEFFVDQLIIIGITIRKL